MNNYVFVLKKHLETVCCIVAALLFLCLVYGFHIVEVVKRVVKSAASLRQPSSSRQRRGSWRAN